MEYLQTTQLSPNGAAAGTARILPIGSQARKQSPIASAESRQTNREEFRTLARTIYDAMPEELLEGFTADLGTRAGLGIGALSAA